MAILYDKDLEIRTLYAITESTEISDYFLSVITEEYFNYPPVRSAFRRIQGMLRSRSTLMDWSTLCADPTISESHREVLVHVTEIRRVKTVELARHIYETLDRYRVARILNAACENVLSTLDKESFDVEVLLDSLSDSITLARSTKGTQKVWHIGVGNNTTPLVTHILDRDRKVPLIPSGFTSFDKVTGGLPETGVVILAAPTSCGKSVMGQQIAVNMYKYQTRSVVVVTMEMGEHQYMTRVVSSLSGVPDTKLKTKQFTDEDAALVRSSYKKHVLHGKQNDCRFSILNPQEEMTITQLLRVLKPYQYEVVVIDYIGLLRGLSGEGSQKQWELMSAAVREAKIYADNNKCLMVILAQLDENTEQLRYAKGMKDHADNMWSWGLKQGDRDAKRMTIHQVKGRDNPVFNFETTFDFEIMRIWDNESPIAGNVPPQMDTTCFSDTPPDIDLNLGA